MTKVARFVVLFCLLCSPLAAERKRIEDNPVRSPIAPETSDLLWAKKSPYGTGDDYRLPLSDLTIEILGDVDYSGGDPEVNDHLIFDGVAWVPSPGGEAAALDGDYGDFTCVASVCDLDADVVTATEAADLFVFIAGDASLGTLTWANAAGPAIMDEAASDTNPTLVPNRAQSSYGVGYSSGNLYLISNGASALSVDATQTSAFWGDLVVLDEKTFQLREDNANGSNFKGFKAPAAITTDTTCTLLDSARFIESDCIEDVYVFVAGDTGLGTLTWSDAAGPSIRDEAASSTNPTLVPNRALLEDGVGHDGTTGVLIDNGELIAKWATGGFSIRRGLGLSLYEDDNVDAVFLLPPSTMSAGRNCQFVDANRMIPASCIGLAALFQITPQASAPGTCAIGDVYVDTSGAYCGCSATDTWEIFNATGTCA